MLFKLFLLIGGEAIVAMILALIDEKIGAIYHMTFWGHALMIFCFMFLGGVPVLLYIGQ